jgi:ABC-type glycerol-3-phosphate transport system substrate-binding protein
MRNRLVVGAVAALVLSAMSAGAAVAAPAAPHDVTTTITFRGGWRLAHVHLR